MRMTIWTLGGMAVLGMASAQWRGPAANPGMRPGQPQVLVPEVQATPAAVLPWDGLRSRLGRRNRVMLFWEAELDGSVGTRYREVETRDRHDHARAARMDGVAMTYDGPVGVSVAGGQSGSHERRERFLEAEGPDMTRARGEARQLETLFMEQLRQGGVRFIDRTLATRLTARNVEGERPNVHALEARALAGHADYLLQVTSSPQPGTASGRDFHVVLQAIDSGETLLAFDTPALPPDPGPGAYVGTSSGFRRALPPAPGPADIARVLAIETAERMKGVVR